MTTLRVSTTVDVSRIQGGAKQLPFAMSKAINTALVKAQAKQLAHMQREFTIRRPQFAKLSTKITKFAKKTSLIGEIAIAPPGDRADIFAKFELGGTKRPKDGRNIAIPITGSPVKKSARTIVSDQNRPKALLSGATTIQTRSGKVKAVKRAKSFGGAFLIPAHDGKPGGIFIRAGKKVKLAYTLQPKAEIKPRLDFVETVSTSINQTWAEDFAREFANAMRTAKR
jgi:hypothetical protein